MCEIPLIISFYMKVLSLNLNSLDRIFEPFIIITTSFIWPKLFWDYYYWEGGKWIEVGGNRVNYSGKVIFEELKDHLVS